MKSYKLIAIALAALLAVGCAKNRKSEGLMDDPQTHFDNGKKYWEKKDMARAMDEFKLAQSLDRKFGPAYAGFALVEASQGKFDSAEDNAEKAIDLLDDKSPIGWIAMGVVEQEKGLSDPKREKEWYEDAAKAFGKAIKIAPKQGEPYFRRGILYKVAFEFRKSEDDFKQVLELKNGYETEANAEWEVVQKILRAAPGTRVGAKVALVDEITKADLAALFIAELELDRLLEKRQDKAYDNSFAAPADPRKMEVQALVKTVDDIVDMKTHWARNFVADLHKLGIRGLEVGPDHKFYPDEKITRAQYAMFVEAILLAVNNDPALATKHLGDAQSRFKDVPLGVPYYNAVCNMADMGIMKANLMSEFDPMKTVSGPDALLIIRSIKELRK
jgi:tetratricopeptide (TPR) repeat protein